MSHDLKIVRHLAKQDLPDFFRELAKALESGGHDDFPGLEDFRGLKLKAKDEFGLISLKLKAEFDEDDDLGEDEADEDASGKPKYKRLKKRMESAFKVVETMIGEELIPTKEAVEAFLSDAGLMVTYPDNGDEYCREFTEACAAFEAAYASGNLKDMAGAVEELSALQDRRRAKHE